MSATTIPWCHYTLNAWWGCTKIAPECANCYAEAWAKRTGHDVWGPNAGRRFFGDEHFEEPLRWNAQAEREGQRKRVFCASMSDILEYPPPTLALVPDMGRARQKVWSLIERTPWLDWLLLSKRLDNLWLTPWARRDRPEPWPDNVWLGTTAGTQARANEMIPLLLASGARTLFVSCEPALELVDFTRIEHGGLVIDALAGWTEGRGPRQMRRLDWVIVGGESGPRARPFALDWAREIVRACGVAGVAAFVKQLGERPGEFVAGDLVELLVRGKRSKNEDPAEWPEDLRVREFPRPPSERAA